AALRNPGRDPHAPHPRRRPGRHVHRAGGHPGPRTRARGLRPVPGQQFGRRPVRSAARPRRGRRSGPGGRQPDGFAAARAHDAGMSIPAELRDAAYRWIADDIDEATKAELQQVLARALGGDPAARDDLADRMAGPLKFGTAGLRGPVRAGPNGMNRAVVVRTTAGVASWLQANGHGGGLVVVGRDARRGSEAFAADAAGVLAAAGFDVRLLSRPLPTPVLAFAVGHLNAAAGIQITASHNPAPDNGYKL